MNSIADILMSVDGSDEKEKMCAKKIMRKENNRMMKICNQLSVMIFENSHYYDKLIAMEPKLFLFMNENDMSEIQIIEVMKKDGLMLYYCNNKTYDMCLNAVIQNGLSLKYVDVEFQDENMCMEAIKQNVFSFLYVDDSYCNYEICYFVINILYEKYKKYELYIEFVLDDNDPLFPLTIENYYTPIMWKDKRHNEICDEIKNICEIVKKVIKNNDDFNESIIDISSSFLALMDNQTKEICIKSINVYFENLKYMKYKNDEICLEAVKRNGLALHFVKEQTEEICLEAVKQNGMALVFVKEQTEEMCLEAVKRNGMTLRFVKEQTEEMCMEAVKYDGNALKYVEEQTEEICLEAIKRNGMALEFVKKQTEEICLEAVKYNGNALKYVKEQTEEICLQAIKQCCEAIIYVKKQYLETIKI